MNLLELFGIMLFVAAGLATLGILAGYPAAHWIGGKVATFLTFLPTEKFARPQPALGIPRTMALRGDLRGAADCYEAMLLEHPREKEIYYRLLEIVLGPLHDEDRGRDIIHRATGQFTDPAERGALLHFCDELLEGSYRPFPHMDENAKPLPPVILPNLTERRSRSS